jgi:hypothetical protein
LNEEGEGARKAVGGDARYDLAGRRLEFRRCTQK